MSEEVALAYINWANQFALNKVKILIADDIAQYNYLAFSHSTRPGALNCARRDGDKYQVFFEKLRSKHHLNFDIIRWNEITSKKYYTTLNHVEDEFETNDKFKKSIRVC